MSRRLLVAVLGAALAITGLTASPARAATWPEPVVVAPATSPFNYRWDPQVVVTPDGTTVAAWYASGDELNDAIAVAERPPGGSWGPPVAIATDALLLSDLAVGDDGTLAVAYATLVGGKLVINAAVRPAGAAWGAPVPLSDASKTSTAAHVAVGAGRVTAVWVQDTAAASQVFVNSRTLGVAGTWGSAEAFSDTGVSGTDVAASPAGTLVTWLHSSDPTNSYAASTVRASFHGTTGSWAAPVSLSESGRRVQTAEPAVGTDGTLAVTWESRLPGTVGYYNSARTMAAIRPSGGAWGTESLLSDPDIEGRYPHIGVGPDGTTTVVWESYDGATEKVATRVHQGGSWEAETDLTQSVDSQSSPLLAMSADGTAVVEFSDLANGIGVAIRPPGSGWRPTDFVATAAQSGYDRAVAAGGGAVAVLWTHGNDYVLLAVVADHLLPLPPLPPPTAETGPVTGPSKIAKGKKASYAFTGTPASVTFQCRVDTTRHQQTGAKGKKGKKPIAWRACHSPLKVKTKKLKQGHHTLYVRAVLGGVPDATPSTKRFKVK